ncbi:MAG: FAD-dependent oxidoreductase [Pseudomonadota bacterium]
MADRTDINYTFSDADLEQLKAYGTIESYEKGALIQPEGELGVACIITLSGYTDIMMRSGEEDERLGWMEPGQFSGDVSVLTGERSVVSVYMGEAGEVLRIERSQFERLLVENSYFSDIFVRVLTARRQFGLSRDMQSILVIGPKTDRATYTIRDQLSAHHQPYRWLDAESDDLAQRLLKSKGLERPEWPVVLLGGSDVMIAPSPSKLAGVLGLDLLPDGAAADVIVVGAGPGGLAASVYAASEGLSVLTLDARAPGGQAGTSSKIENYLGFPLGVSGSELAARAVVQAQKFGTRIASPVSAIKLERSPQGFCLTLDDQRKVEARAVVLAAGAQYRRLPIDGIEDYEGRGIYYGATPLEAQLCGGTEVTLVGAGNSAGQGAVYLASVAKQVNVVYRRSDIRDTMSEYLVRRLEEAPNIALYPNSEVVEVAGSDASGSTHLNQVTLLNRQTGARSTCASPFLFLFLGAAPCSDWLPADIATDPRGFVLTGREISEDELGVAGWSRKRTPTRFETSWPGVFAVGDIRSGSVKRVASSVGEGSVVVSDVHKILSEAAD